MDFAPKKKIFSGGRGSSGRKFCNLWLYLSPAILFCPRQELSTYLNYYLTCFCSYFWAKKRNKTFDPTICSLVSRFFPLLLIFFAKKKSDKIRNVSVCVRYLVHPRWYFSHLHFCLRNIRTWCATMHFLMKYSISRNENRDTFFIQVKGKNSCDEKLLLGMGWPLNSF